MKNFRIQSLIVFASCVLFLASCEGGKNGQQGRFETANQKLQSAEQLRPVSKVADDLRELIIDLAAYNACGYLKGRIMPLSAEGAQSVGGQKPDAGNIWIYDCLASQPEPDQLQIQLKAKGWKWIDQETETAGATFGIDEILTFEFELSTTGTFDLVYDPQTHIATVYFVPIEPINVQFRLKSDIDVETENLWSWIVGQAAPVAGKGLEERAQTTARERGAKTLIAKLKHGFTIIIDLCNSSYYTKFGNFPSGQLPEKAIGKNAVYEINSRAILHENSMLMAGPFDPDQDVLVTFENDDRPFQARWACEDDAKIIAWDYVDNMTPNITETLASITVDAGETAEFRPPRDSNCPMVLIMKPTTNTPVSFRYKVEFLNKKFKPLVECQ